MDREICEVKYSEEYSESIGSRWITISHLHEMSIVRTLVACNYIRSRHESSLLVKIHEAKVRASSEDEILGQ